MSEIVVVRRTQASVRRAQLELAATPDVHCVGGTQELAHAADLILRHKPKVLLCDLRLVGGNAMHLLKALHKSAQQASPPRVLLLTPSADDLLLFHALRAGAHGYAIDLGGPEVLGNAVLDLLADQAPMSPMIARQMLASFGEPRAPMKLAMQAPPPVTAGAGARLPETDRRLLSLLAHGLLVHEIARAWGLAFEQIGRQIGLLYRKLHAWHKTTPALAAPP